MMETINGECFQFALHFFNFLNRLENKWWIFVDKLTSSMETTGDPSKMLVTKTITKRALVQHLCWDQFQLAAANELGNIPNFSLVIGEY